MVGIAVNCASIPLLLLTDLILRRQRQEKHEYYKLHAQLPAKNYIILIIAIISAIIYLFPIQSLALSSPDANFEKTTVTIVTVSGIIFVAICAFYFYSINKNEYYSFENRTYKTLLKNQEEYYTALLAREEQTRSLRHDLEYHVSVVTKLLDNQEVLQAKKYLSDLSSLTQGTNIKIDTGNNIVNIVINDIWGSAEDVELQWHGIFGGSNKLSDIDICIFFSNILRNAVQSTEKCKANRTVKAELKQMATALYFKCENPVSEPVVFKNGRPISKKADTRIHGIGLMNVEGIVKKYGGSITYSATENFIVEIVLEDVLL